MLDAYGDLIYKFMPVPTGYGRRTVDYLLCVDGLFVAVEAKRPKGKPTAKQEDTLQQVRAARGTTYVVNDDASLDVFAKFLDLVFSKKGAPIVDDSE